MERAYKAKMPDGQRIGADRLWDVLDAGISSKQPLGRILHQSLGAGPRGGGNLRKLRFLLGREMYFHALKGTRTPGAQQHRNKRRAAYSVIFAAAALRRVYIGKT